MSIDAFSWAWGLEKITPKQKLLLICLADGADMDNQCRLNFPKLRRFACMNNASDDQILDELRKLKKKGLLDIDFVLDREKPISLYADEQRGWK